MPTRKGNKPIFDDEQIIKAVKETPDFCTSSYVAMKVGCSQSCAQRRLQELLNKKQISGKLIGRVWFYDGKSK